MHAEPRGLDPDRWYFYRFRAGGHISPVGRTRTAPQHSATRPLRFAATSCVYEDPDGPPQPDA